MIAIVRGNDFRLRIPITRSVVGDGVVTKEPLDLDTLESMLVFLEGTDGDGCEYVKKLEWSADKYYESSIIADVEGKIHLGTYALVVVGKTTDGKHFRSKEHRQLRIVDRNEQANVVPFDYDGFDAYAIDTMVILDGRGRDGLSAYEIACAHGFVGTEEEWIESLHVSREELQKLYNAISGKQDSLTFDEEPTEGSSNPVKSSGIKAAIEGIPQATPEKAGLMSSEDKEKIDEMGYATEQEVKDLFDGDVFPPEDVATDEDIEHLFD